MSNLCKESGCIASCCHDMKLPWRDKTDDPSRYFSDVFPITSEADITKEGVFILEESVIIIGTCPNNAPDSSCTIYTERPKPCRTLSIFKEHCMEARKRDGVAEINPNVYRHAECE